ncbi:GxxExxY protein [bacterium]|nr:GxxExxY protein [bacterium]
MSIENPVSRQVIDAAMRVHSELGPGLLERAYQAALAVEFDAQGVTFEAEVPVGLKYRDQIIDQAFRADFVVENCVLVELKSVENIAPVHAKQVLTYLRLTNLRLGLLLNFGAASLRDGIRRIANGMPD